MDFHRITKKKKKVEIGRDLWMSTDVTLLFEQSHLQPAGQDRIQTAFQYIQG